MLTTLTGSLKVSWAAAALSRPSAHAAAALLFIPRTVFRSCVSNDGLSGHRIICKNDRTVNECGSVRLCSHPVFMTGKDKWGEYVQVCGSECLLECLSDLNMSLCAFMCVCTCMCGFEMEHQEDRKCLSFWKLEACWENDDSVNTSVWTKSSFWSCDFSANLNICAVNVYSPQTANVLSTAQISHFTRNSTSLCHFPPDIFPFLSSACSWFVVIKPWDKC